MKTNITKGYYRCYNEYYKKLPFGELIKITDIIIYNKKEYGYFKDLNILLPVNELEYVLKKEESIIEQISNNIKDQYIFTLDISKDEFKNIILKQQEKGIKKYGHSIDDCPNDKYDWKTMMYEELADLLIYNEKLNRSNNE